MISKRLFALGLIATSQVTIAGASVAQEWTPTDELVHNPTPTTDPQGFNFVSGGYCVSEPLSNFPEGSTSLALSTSFCLPVVRGCDGSAYMADTCPNQAVANRNRNAGAIIHNSLNAVSWGSVSYLGGMPSGRYYSISMPAASGVSIKSLGYLNNSDGSRIRASIGSTFVTTLEDAQQNSLGSLDAAGSLMIEQDLPADVSSPLNCRVAR